MQKRLLLIPAAAAVAAVIAITASNSTGANFSDTQNGKITGTVGNVHVTGSGGSGADNMDLQFTGLLPGTPQSVTDTFQNTGSGPEDIWLVFPNATALSALNNLGTFGQVNIYVNGTDIWSSANLNDNYPCPTPGNPGVPTLCALPNVLELQAGLGSGGAENFTFQFSYSSALHTQPAAGALAPVWNTYPVSGQHTTNVGDGSGSGLPYEFVAEQPGVVPSV